MSPNEFQLRAALRDGEGDVPDAETAIAGALRQRRARRRLITSIGSGVAVVGVAVALITTLVQKPSNESGGAADAPAVSRKLPGAGSAASAHRPGEPRGAGVACPATFPRLLLPGGGSNQFGGDGPMFSAAVASIKVCSYGPRQGGIELKGAAAVSLAASLEARGDPGDSLDCKAITSPEYALYAVSDSGHALRVVTAEQGCLDYKVTNGTAVRWIPVAQFRTFGLPTLGASPNQGTPVK